jgi:hypothetical protein
MDDSGEGTLHETPERFGAGDPRSGSRFESLPSREDSAPCRQEVAEDAGASRTTHRADIKVACDLRERRVRRGNSDVDTAPKRREEWGELNSAGEVCRAERGCPARPILAE